MSTANPISEAQLAANRENAQFSTGPRTETGKTRVRLNGLRHGLTGNTVLMPNEDRAVYEAFTAQTIESLLPGNNEELVLAQSIADDRWRLNRALAIEQNVFALGSVANPVDLDENEDVNAALTQARTFLENARQIQLLTLYESRIQRNHNRNLAELRARQDARLVLFDQAVEEAMLLRQLEVASKRSGPIPTDADSESETGGNGFGFSRAFLDRRIDRKCRLEEARAQFPTPKIPCDRPLKRAA